MQKRHGSVKLALRSRIAGRGKMHYAQIRSVAVMMLLRQTVHQEQGEKKFEKQSPPLPPHCLVLFLDLLMEKGWRRG